jgi:hypothetical protein
LDVMSGSNFSVGLAVDVRVMSSALIGVLPLGTHIIFFLLPTALLACRVILLNDVGTSFFGLAFRPVGLLANTMGGNLFPNSCPPVLVLELPSAEFCCFLSFANIDFLLCASRFEPSFELSFCFVRQAFFRPMWPT